jgi:hypothetical protein
LGQPEAIAAAVLKLLEHAPPPAVWRKQADKFDLSVSVNTVRQLYQTTNNRRAVKA